MRHCLAAIVSFLLLPLAAAADDDPGAPVRAERFMAVAANPHASRAGLKMLEAGGSAVDAAIAMQAVLSLVEPQSSGIGGGGFLLHYAAADGALVAYDGRETAPMAVDETLFLDEAGKPLDFLAAALGGRAVGTPGVMAMLAMAHEDHGRLDWAKLFAPAIRLARDGFAVSPRLHMLLARRAELYRERGLDLGDLGAAGSYFFVETEAGLAAKPAGTLLSNPAYAATLETIAREGVEPFYRGTIARAIVEAVRSNPFGPGALALEDLARYAPRRTAPICGPYRSYRLCAMGPPSSGATTMLAILGLLEGFDMKAAGPMTARSVHLFAEASQLAYADRDLYVSDADFVPVPVAGLIDPGYLAGRRALIDEARAMGRASAGTPPGAAAAAAGEGPDGPSTSHLVAADAEGNVVSFTTTVQIAFGSFVMAEGFLLNNQLTDFSFLPERDGRPVANRVEPGKKPRSSMTPTIAFDDKGRVAFAIGSPGGSRIIDYVTKAAVGLVDWDLDIQAAIALPNIIGKDGVLELERGSAAEALADDLAALGHEIRLRELDSGLHGVAVSYEKDGTRRLTGAADPRREGVALGE